MENRFRDDDSDAIDEVRLQEHDPERKAASGPTRKHVLLGIGGAAALAVTRIIPDKTQSPQSAPAQSAPASAPGGPASGVPHAELMADTAFADVTAPAITTSSVSAASGSFAAAQVLTLLSVGPFPVTGGYLRLYSNSADQATDAGRAEGTAPAVSGLLYDFSAEADNTDAAPLILYPGSGATLYWNLGGAGPVNLTWVAQLTA
jgi:hypothetical protein